MDESSQEKYNCSNLPYQYDRSAILEQQRLKEAEALDMCARLMIQNRLNDDAAITTSMNIPPNSIVNNANQPPNRATFPQQRSQQQSHQVYDLQL